MFLHNNEIRYDIIINNAPYGERILVNDMKPSGLITALAFNSSRDKFFNTIFEEEKELWQKKKKIIKSNLKSAKMEKNFFSSGWW